ncbi:hypothetical protein IAD21_00645 [Abditibacteriota bacterium]|nr:hypothetical protein IAD21_00645 [Abditibacteriota bacterium]
MPTRLGLRPVAHAQQQENTPASFIVTPTDNTNSSSCTSNAPYTLRADLTCRNRAPRVTISHSDKGADCVTILPICALPLLL